MKKKTKNINIYIYPKDYNAYLARVSVLEKAGLATQELLEYRDYMICEYLREETIKKRRTNEISNMER